jgi:Fic family protein
LPPVQAAFYLLTRIPYLQPFQDGNKRTSRALCNVPLLQAGLPPISFVDFAKQDYIVSLLAFYELGDVRLAERCFVAAYKKSAARLVKKTI